MTSPSSGDAGQIAAPWIALGARFASGESTAMHGASTTISPLISSWNRYSPASGANTLGSANHHDQYNEKNSELLNPISFVSNALAPSGRTTRKRHDDCAGRLRTTTQRYAFVSTPRWYTPPIGKMSGGKNPAGSVVVTAASRIDSARSIAGCSTKRLAGPLQSPANASRGVPSTRVSKCRCGANEHPLEPISPSCSPATTCWPTLTATLPRFMCRYQLCWPFGCPSITKFVSNDAHDSFRSGWPSSVNSTTPSAAAKIGMPTADASGPISLKVRISVSTPACPL